MRKVFLAPGASGSVAGMRPWLNGLQARGIEAHGVALPRGSAEGALPAYRRQAPADATIVIGGQSFGGRVASLLAAGQEYGALILLSYPLHRPGHPDMWVERTAHWPAIACPVLLLSGRSDPFARIDLLEAAAPLLRRARLVTFRGLGHNLLRAGERAGEPALDAITDWLAETLPDPRSFSS